eukprot:43994_1
MNTFAKPSLVVAAISSICFTIACLIQIFISSLSTPKILLYRWLILLSSIMMTCISIIVLANGSQLNQPNHHALSFICKFLRSTTVLILLGISVPFMTDIFHAATESSHFFYKDESSKELSKEQDSNLAHFKQSIQEHNHVMKFVAISCKYIGIMGFISYLTLELVSSLANLIIAQIVSRYLILIIALFFAICNMFHHLRLYQHMNKLHRFILTCQECKPKILAKFVMAKKRLLLISATSFVVVVIVFISLVINQKYSSLDLFATDLGYRGYVWTVMMYQLIFHVWSFQSWTRIPKSSFAYALCHCCLCCRNVWMEKSKHVQHLGTDIGQFGKEQRDKPMAIVVTAPQKQQRDYLQPTKHVQTLTPYSPGHQYTPSVSMSVGDDDPYSQIKVVIYDINVLLSLAYTTQDALELIQTRPIEWMTNKHVKNRIFNFEHNRSDILRKHIEYIRHKGRKTICVISNGFDDVKMKTLIQMLKAEALIDMTYSADNDKWNQEKNNLSVIILDIMKRCECKNDQVLYIANELEQIKYLKQIDLCALFPLYTSDMDEVQIPTNLTNRHINDLNQFLIK